MSNSTKEIKDLDIGRIFKAAKCHSAVRYMFYNNRKPEFYIGKIESLNFRLKSDPTIKFIDGPEYNLNTVVIYDDQQLAFRSFKEAVLKFEKMVPVAVWPLERHFKYTFKKASKIRCKGGHVSFAFEDESGKRIRPTLSTKLVFRYHPFNRTERKIKMEVPTSEIFCLNNSNTQQ